MITFIILSLIFTQWLETQIVVGKNPVNVCYNSINHKVYSLNLSSSSISIINAATNQVIQTIFLNHPFGVIAYNSWNNKIYCSCDSSGEIFIAVIDGATNQIIKNIPNPSSGGRLFCNPINNKIYCFNHDANNVTVFDGERDSLIKIIQHGIGEGPGEGCFAFRLNKIYCFNTWNGTVSVISSDLDSVIKVISVAPRPGAICYNSKNNKVYVGHIYDPVVEVICAEGDTLITTLYTGAPGQEVFAYDSIYNKIYFPTLDCVIVIDGESDMIVDRIYFEGYPWIVFFNPINKKIYCSYYVMREQQCLIGIIDAQTHRVVNTIPLYRIGAFYPFCLNPRENRVYVPHAWSDNSGTPRDSVISVIRDVISVEENSFSYPPITYFPNPLKPKFIVLPNDIKNLEIYDINGNLIKKTKEFKISLEGIRKGVYFIKIIAHQKVYIKKINIL